MGNDLHLYKHARKRMYHVTIPVHWACTWGDKQEADCQIAGITARLLHVWGDKIQDYTAQQRLQRQKGEKWLYFVIHAAFITGSQS